MPISNWISRSQNILPIGLDIGHCAVKMVQLAMTDDGMCVVAADRAPVNWEAADETGRQATVVSAIRLLLARGHFKGRDVISALPADKLRITSLRLAEGEMVSTERTLRKEAAHRFGLDPRIDAINYILAGTVRQGDELKNEYILFATDDKTIKSHIALLEEAGLTPISIDAGPCALFRNFERTLRRQEDRERTIIFIDVGHRHTIVVFGRIREDLKIMKGVDLKTIINTSINQTLSRTLLTSLTTLLVVFCLFLFGGQAINDFAFALLVGVIVGTYSSIFVASPIVYLLERKS